MTGFSLAVRFTARHIASDAAALPPGEFTRSTTASVRESVRAVSSASVRGVEPSAWEPPMGDWPFGSPTTMRPCAYTMSTCPLPVYDWPALSADTRW